MQRDGWKCSQCGSETKTLNVHHVQYLNGHAPWEYPKNYLITLCEDCHAESHGLQIKPEITEAERAAWEPEYVPVELPELTSRNDVEQEKDEMLQFITEVCALEHNYFACIESIFYDSKANLCSFKWTPLSSLLKSEEWEKLKQVAHRHISQFQWIDGAVYGKGCEIL